MTTSLLNREHPLHRFIFCPACGANAFVDRNEKARQCNVCGFTYYYNPAAATAGFIRNPQGEILLVSRGFEPAKGTLDLPGGFADRNETIEEALRREVREETGLELTYMRYLFSIPNIYPYLGFDVHTIDMFFECGTYSFGEAVPNDDAAGLHVRRLESLSPAEFGLASVRKAVERYKNHEGQHSRKEHWHFIM